MSGKTGKAVRLGRCIEKGCDEARVPSSWYCQRHDWRGGRLDDIDRAVDAETLPKKTESPDDACVCGHSRQAHYRDNKSGVRCNGMSCTCRGFMTAVGASSKVDTRVPAESGNGKNSWLDGRPAPLKVTYCDHHGEPFCLTLSDGRQLAGAQGARLNDIGAAQPFDLIIDCAGMVEGSRFVLKSTNPRFRALNQLAFPDVLRLQWPDMTAPSHVGIRFWLALKDLLPEKTCVCCVGGHGRTGTCLACLLVADGVDPDVAITMVRDKHCGRAIETPAQVDYIKVLARQRDGTREEK